LSLVCVQDEKHLMPPPAHPAHRRRRVDRSQSRSRSSSRDSLNSQPVSQSTRYTRNIQSQKPGWARNSLRLDKVLKTLWVEKYYHTFTTVIFFYSTTVCFSALVFVLLGRDSCVREHCFREEMYYIDGCALCFSAIGDHQGGGGSVTRSESDPALARKTFV
jgi:hypothetical protein